jgi:acyl-CoA synthetase (NDP forming)
MKDGVAFLAGIDAGLAGIQAAVDVGAAWRRSPGLPLLKNTGHQPDGPITVLDEAESKDLLARWGVPVPSGRIVTSAGEAAAAAEELGYPVVVKALGVTHKTEAGGVRLSLNSADEVSVAVTEMSGLSASYLIEKMIEGVVAELIVGVARDEQFGPYLLVGGGGIMVELMRDSASILLPTTAEYVSQALGHLKCAPLLNCFRGCQPVDLNAAVDVILKVAAMVEKDPSSIIELDINPLMLLADGQGVVAADALIGLNAEFASDPRKKSGLRKANPNE